MTYDEMVSHNDVFASAIISNMKALQAATNVSNIVTRLETLIDTLTKLGNVLGKLNGSTQDGGITGLLNRLQRAIGTFSDKSSGKGFWGRLADGFKSFLGIGNGGNAIASHASSVGKGLIEALEGTKVEAARSAQGLLNILGYDLFGIGSDTASCAGAPSLANIVIQNGVFDGVYIQNQGGVSVATIDPQNEPHFIIDADTRVITVPSAFTFLGLKGDHNMSVLLA